jgi:16S rRNA (guanine966-N2)-methyltransferase
MRIVGGIYGGRKFNPPSKIPARPTTDMAKEGLFNMLNSMIDIEGTKILDLFAGTGNISFEFASRGAEKIVLVEKDRTSVQFIKDTFSLLGYSHYQAIQGDALKYIPQAIECYDVVFADPPYALPQMGILPDLVLQSNLLHGDSLFILEHTHNVQFEKHPHFMKSKKYGDSYFSIFQK